MKTVIQVEEFKADQCPASIRSAIGFHSGIYGIQIDVAHKTISVDHTDEISENELSTIIGNALKNTSTCQK